MYLVCMYVHTYVHTDVIRVRIIVIKVQIMSVQYYVIPGAFLLHN